MEISIHGTGIVWKVVSRDHDISLLVWFHEPISSLGTSTHGGLIVLSNVFE